MKKYVVITGASSGIGQELTMRFANLDCHIIAIVRNEIALQRTKLITRNRKLTVVVADLSEESELDKIVRAFKIEDKIQYLVHCAATTEPHSPLTMVSRTELEKAINVNVMTPLFLTQKLAPFFNFMMTRVLFIGSDYVGINNSIRPNITGSYAISKSALRVVVEYFRHEYKDTALIGYLNPGSTNTPMFNAVKTAVLCRSGSLTSSAQPVHPSCVAKFIHAVLENTSNHDYSKIDWDYRNEEHRALSLMNGSTISTVNSRFVMSKLI